MDGNCQGLVSKIHHSIKTIFTGDALRESDADQRPGGGAWSISETSISETSESSRG